MVSHARWAGAALVGALVGRIIPAGVVGFGFALTAMFITLLVDSLRNNPILFQLLSAGVSVAVAAIVEAHFPYWFLIADLGTYLALMTGRYFSMSDAQKMEVR